MSKARARKAAAKKSRKNHKVTSKIGLRKGGDSPRKADPRVVAEQARDTYRRSAAQLEKVHALVPDSMHALVQRNIAQTRAVYERSKDVFQAVLASWEKSFGAAGQGAVAFNRKMMSNTERNISSAFDLSMKLAGAKSLAEAMELQSAYWRKQLDELRRQSEQVRLLSTKTAANVADPIKAQVTRGTS